MMCYPKTRMQQKRKKMAGNSETKKTNPEVTQSLPENKECEVILPPGGGKIIPYNNEKSFRTYEPENLPCLPKQCTVPQRMAVPSGMSGQFHFVSTKSLNSSETVKLSVTDYLERYIDMYVCLDFWQGNDCKKEKCGILNEVGKDFIVIEDTTTQMLSVIDLKPVHYINIYCP